MAEQRSQSRVTVVSPKPAPSKYPRIREMYTSSDWWSVWIGFSFLFPSAIAQHFFNANKTHIPTPGEWTLDILDSLKGADMFGVESGQSAARGVAGLVWWGVAMFLPVCFCVRALKTPVSKIILPFAFNYFLATISHILGAHKTMEKYGLTSTVWGLFFGLVCINIISRQFPHFPHFLQPCSSNGELFIKVGLVVMCVELSTLFAFGLPALLVSWGVTPWVILFSWNVGIRKILPNSRVLVMLLACGTAVCGTSAIAATKAAINAPQDESVLAISIVSFMTIFVMIALPAFAVAVGMDKVVAGAWMGGSVNNTGNVIAAAGILNDEEAQNIAGIVKMLQNTMIGFITMAVTVYWIVSTPDDDDDENERNGKENENKGNGKENENEGNGKENNHNDDDDDVSVVVVSGDVASGSGVEGTTDIEMQTMGANSVDNTQQTKQTKQTKQNKDPKKQPKKKLKWPSAIQLYDKFPKFVLGYFAASCIVTLLGMQSGMGKSGVNDLLAMLNRVSRAFTLLGFVCLGQETNFSVMASKMQGGRVLAFYWIAEMFNIVLTFVVAWLCFGVLKLQNL